VRGLTEASPSQAELVLEEFESSEQEPNYCTDSREGDDPWK